MFTLAGRSDGATSQDGRVRGCYLHGLFADDGYRAAFLGRLKARRTSGVAYDRGVDAALDGIAAGVLEANPKAVEDYRGGKDSAIKFLVGQVMRETRGISDPNSAAETLRRLLDAG